MAVLPVRAQFNSQVMQCSTEFVKNVIVRNYYTDREIIFAYKEDPSVIYSNPPFVGQYQTKIYSKLDNSTGVSILAELPNGYRVYDVGFVSLDNVNNKVYDVCVFCGTQYTYYTNGGVSHFDSNGFVGFINIGSRPRALGDIYINRIAGTKQLKKLVSYSQTNSGQTGNCGTSYLQSGVIDAIGLPDTLVYQQASTCLVRSRFCLECSSSYYQWVTSIYNSTGSTEKFVDITATTNNIVTVSVYEGDTQMLYMRNFPKELVCQGNTPTTALSTSIYSVDLSSINLWGNNLPSPLTTYFKMPVRVSPLQNEEFALSFVAYNGSTPIRKGLYSYRINLSPSPHVVHGVLDTAVVSLIDVSHFPDTMATVVLAKNINNKYIVPTVRWRVVPQLSPPNKIAILRLTSNTNNIFIQSIDAYKYSNNQYIHMGGYFSYTLKRRLQLFEHIYCDQTPATTCFLYRKVFSDIWSINYVYYFPNSLNAVVITDNPIVVTVGGDTVTSRVVCQ